MFDAKVWDLVESPEDAQNLGNRWFYTTKRDQNIEIVRFKARLVAQRYSQIKGLSYNEVFSPVVSFSITRLFFSIFI